MKGWNFGQGVTSTVIGGSLLFVALELCLLAAGFKDHDIARVWGALAIIWAPVFIWGAKPPADDFPN